MKFMGSKRWMLGNGLGELLDDRADKYDRFVDLFCGSGAVSAFVARRHSLPVHACDLQHFSTTLAAAVVERTEPIDCALVFQEWKHAAESKASLRHVPQEERVSKASVLRARAWCGGSTGLITKAYGGHYFSPLQSAWFDAFLSSIPRGPALQDVCIAALIAAASRCCASPGHTAQPFQPTPTARSHIEEAWNRDVPSFVKLGLEEICDQFANVKGSTAVADALVAAQGVRAGDLVFVDPPYSGVHYSRFYHVLETIARRECGAVSGVGRYPSATYRPRSDFSMKRTATPAMNALLGRLANQRATVVLTFPAHACSNGLSGSSVLKIAGKFFLSEVVKVSSRFSTLGGPAKDVPSSKRRARRNATELILVLKPKQTHRLASRSL